jgi:hypothetical protein
MVAHVYDLRFGEGISRRITVTRQPQAKTQKSIKKKKLKQKMAGVVD